MSAPDSSKTTVLLDIDGTLVDSNDLHAEAWVECLAGAGHPTTFAAVRPLIGMGGDKVLPLLTGLDPESDAGKQISQQRTKLFLERYMPRVRPFPGTRSLLEQLRARGFQLVVATSANTEELSGLLERGGIADLLPVRTGSDDAEHSKPDDDILVAALRKAGASADAAWMLGDTPYDAKAAQGAGVSFVGLSSGGYDARALEGAVAVYKDPRDLVENLELSPFATRTRAAR